MMKTQSQTIRLAAALAAFLAVSALGADWAAAQLVVSEIIDATGAGGVSAAVARARDVTAMAPDCRTDARRPSAKYVACCRQRATCCALREIERDSRAPHGAKIARAPRAGAPPSRSTGPAR